MDFIDLFQLFQENIPSEEPVFQMSIQDTNLLFDYREGVHTREEMIGVDGIYIYGSTSIFFYEVESRN